MKVNEVLEGLIEYIKSNYSIEEDCDIRGIHVELIGVNPVGKQWNIGIMLPDGTQWLKVVQQ